MLQMVEEHKYYHNFAVICEQVFNEVEASLKSNRQSTTTVYQNSDTPDEYSNETKNRQMLQSVVYSRSDQ